MENKSVIDDLTREPIRVLHFADVHIGMENYGRTDPDSGVSSRVSDFLARMDDMIAFARDGDVDLVIFAGDAFRSRSPNQTYQREFAGRVQALAPIGPRPCCWWAITTCRRTPPKLPPSTSTTPSLCPTCWWRVIFPFMKSRPNEAMSSLARAPYPLRARLLADVATRGKTIAEQDAELRRVVHERLRALSVQAERQAADDPPRLLCGHFSVSGAVWGSERSVMLGRDVTIELDALTHGGWDFFGIMSALGHIHRHQNLTADREDLPPVCL